MIEFEKPYFRKPYYFRLEDGKDKISLYYSVSETISEAKGKDNKIDFDKTSESELKKLIKKILDSGKKLNPKDVYNNLFKLKNKSKNTKPKKEGGEIEELVDDDGTLSTSNIPILKQDEHTNWTQDMRAALIRNAGSTFPFKARIYYGESKEEEPVVTEVDYSDAFGYDETEDKDFKGTVNTLKKMGVENPVERAKQFGKLPKAKKKNGMLRQRLSEKDSIEEEQKKRMEKMVEDILTKRYQDDSEVVEKESGINKILMKNLQSIKKLAEKEGISVSQLIKMLKNNE